MNLLPSTTWGAGSAITLCHGFTQNASSWGRFGELLGTQRTVEAVDLPGHGRATELPAGLDQAAAALLSTIGEGPSDLLGYSMGGRIALTAALHAPERIRRLILIGATAGIADPDARTARRDADERLASSLEHDHDLEAFIDRWLAQPIFAHLPKDLAGRTARLDNTARGLAMSLRGAGTGSQEPSWEQLRTLPCPTLILVGAHDDRFIALANRFVELMPSGTLSLVSGAGHACHLEQPALSARIVLSWLAATDAQVHARPPASSAPTTS